MSDVRIIIAIILISIGMIFSVLSAIGVFRFKFVLNRMHAAAVADTCGLFFALVGLMVLTGFTFTTLKLGVIIFFFWVGSPVTGHLLSNLVYHTENEDVKDNTD